MDTTQGSNVAPPPRLPRPPRPYSWLDSPPETCFSSEGESTNPNRSPSSSSSGFVFSQIHASPHRRKKKMSPPCISVDPPSDESGLYPPGVVVVGGGGGLGLGLPSPLPSRDTCLRRRVPSSDSFDLGVTGGEGGSVQLLTPPREEKL
ncbi:Voltage-dependent T-type calcium channel subunit alpha-1H [Dissostichus eleginoides]|uniref:Voltage-dependent T-type calcium channel subunit alpha-1H n=1 Tax=Dissostichus eleginoides TaxID=100907 RepID=A0AAD9BG11_DISEL|nr:Voltage-dependent T-type calcium channel subunit alpha-1H [Dissostichus eleginoides]